MTPMIAVSGRDLVQQLKTNQARIAPSLILRRAAYIRPGCHRGFISAW
jgi:tetrahydrodipicolinate N-succinyltransferase